MASTSIATAATAASDFPGAFPEFEPPSPLIFPVFEFFEDVVDVGVVPLLTSAVEDVRGFEGFESRDLLLPSDLTLAAALDEGVVDSCNVDLIFSFEMQFGQFSISGTCTVVKLTD